MTMHISAIYTYPIKSCGGLAHDIRTLDRRGLQFDRHWMIVYADGKDQGTFITGRDYPKLALIKPRFEGDTLAIQVPNTPTLTVPLQQRSQTGISVVVWNDTCQAIDEGDTVAHALSNFLGVSVRLVSIADSFTRVIDTEYTSTPTETGFGDGYPLLIASEASLNDLNDRLLMRGKDAVTMNRFRPNVVVSGCDAYAEDTWKKIMLGDVAFDVVKPCKRCSMVTIDWDSGEIPDVKEPTATLAEYRRWNGGVTFGQNIVHRGTGELRVGQTVRIIE